MERFGEVYLFPVNCDPLEEMPKFQRDELEQLCFEHILDVTNIPQLMAKLSRALRNQSEFSRMIPLFLLAAVIKNVMGKQLPGGDSSVEFTPALAEHDALQMIRYACNDAQAKFAQSYVQTGKLSNDVLTKYLATVESFLTLKVIENDGEHSSLYTLLSKHLPDLTENEYHVRHKAKLEYVTKFVYTRIKEEMQK